MNGRALLFVLIGAMAGAALAAAPPRERKRAPSMPPIITQADAPPQGSPAMSPDAQQIPPQAAPQQGPAPQPSYSWPAAPPTTQPHVKLPPMDSRFAVLTRRSIFDRGGQVASSPGDGPPPGAVMAMGGPEGSMALRGVQLDDAQFTAFVEDTNTHHTVQVKAGDALAGGHVKQISLDDLLYESHGKLTRIQIGQNLLGVAMAAPANPAGPQGPNPNGPPGPNTAVAAGQVPPEVLQQQQMVMQAMEARQAAMRMKAR